jgi:D-alanyl-D-alanine carboxypeptidase/D-alanyl-D-alanine-endopeptidase (penicillin-binding protein 4)
VTASALPASQARAKPQVTPVVKLGRPTPTVGKPAAKQPAPILAKAAGKPVAKPATVPIPPKAASKPVARPATASGKSAAKPTSKPAAVRCSLASAAKPTLSLGKTSAASTLAGPAEDETPAPATNDPNRERILALQEALTRIVHGTVLGRLRVGMRVLDLATGHVLFTRRGSVLMDPASNQKVLATATALLRLGSTWRFRTELSGPLPDGDGTIAGDLILRGSGDPSLRGAHLDAMAEDLARRGVSRIEGRVLGDPRRIGSDEAAGRSPVRVGWAAIEVQLRPGDRVGASAIASLRPGSDAMRVVNQAVTAKGRGRIGVSVSRVGDQIHVLVTGKIGLGRPGIVVRRAPPSDTLYAAILMRAALLQAGIEVRGLAGVYAGEGRDRLVAAPASADLQLASATQLVDSPVALVRRKHAPGSAILAVHESAPLPLLIRRVNKNSDNEWAERVLEAAGAETYGGSASTAKGVRALREALTDLGVPSSGYSPANGSGLGHQNRVAPATMADLLLRLYFDPRVGPDLLQSLSVGGVDGTTRNRFRGSSAAERVRAKTGTLNGVSCLSGYVGDKSDVVAFSIMVEGHRRRAVTSVRSAQVSAVNAMMRYARGTLGPAPAEAAVPGQDLETGGEAAELEGETELPESAPAQKADPSIDQLLKNFGTPGNEP